MAETLYIKNMVCDRCIMAVRAVLTRCCGIEPLAVELGEVRLPRPLTEQEHETLRRELEDLGFELLEDRRQQLVAQAVVLPDGRGLGVLRHAECHGLVAVHRLQRRKGLLAGRLVLCQFGGGIHAFHADLVHLEDRGIAFFEPLLEEREQLSGIPQPGLEQFARAVQADQVEALQPGPEQQVAAGDQILAVEILALQPPRLVAGGVARREVEALRDDQFRARHAVGALRVEGAVFDRGVLEVVLAPDLLPGRLVLLAERLQRLVVPLDLLQQLVDRLGLASLGHAQEQAGEKKNLSYHGSIGFPGLRVCRGGASTRRRSG